MTYISHLPMDLFNQFLWRIGRSFSISFNRWIRPLKLNALSPLYQDVYVFHLLISANFLTFMGKGGGDSFWFLSETLLHYTVLYVTSLALLLCVCTQYSISLAYCLIHANGRQQTVGMNLNIQPWCDVAVAALRKCQQTIPCFSFVRFAFPKASTCFPYAKQNLLFLLLFVFFFFFFFS